MSDVDRRERAVQAHLEGRIDREELRRRFGDDADAPRSLDEELAAYRAVWEAAEEEPELRLGPGFARRAARRALAGREAETEAARVVAAARRAGVLAAGVSAFTVASALAAAAALLPVAGLEVGAVYGPLLSAAEAVPAALWGAAGAGAVLVAADGIWSGARSPRSGARPA